MSLFEGTTEIIDQSELNRLQTNLFKIKNAHCFNFKSVKEWNVQRNSRNHNQTKHSINFSSFLKNNEEMNKSQRRNSFRNDTPAKNKKKTMHEVW